MKDLDYGWDGCFGLELALSVSWRGQNLFRGMCSIHEPTDTVTRALFFFLLLQTWDIHQASLDSARLVVPLSTWAFTVANSIPAPQSKQTSAAKYIKNRPFRRASLPCVLLDSILWHSRSDSHSRTPKLSNPAETQHPP